MAAKTTGYQNHLKHTQSTWRHVNVGSIKMTIASLPLTTSLPLCKPHWLSTGNAVDMLLYISDDVRSQSKGALNDVQCTVAHELILQFFTLLAKYPSGWTWTNARQADLCQSWQTLDHDVCKLTHSTYRRRLWCFDSYENAIWYRWVGD